MEDNLEKKADGSTPLIFSRRGEGKTTEEYLNELFNTCPKCHQVYKKEILSVKKKTEDLKYDAMPPLIPDSLTIAVTNEIRKIKYSCPCRSFKKTEKWISPDDLEKIERAGAARHIIGEIYSRIRGAEYRARQGKRFIG